MTIRYASSARDPSVQPITPTPAQNSQGDLKALQSNVQLPVGATVADRDVFGRIPTNAKIEPGSKLWNGALTGLTSYDVGLFAETAPFTPDYTQGAAACLISAKDIHLASSQDFSALITPDKGGKSAWELAGLTSDPGGFLCVVGTIHAAGGTATASDWLDLHLHYRRPE